MTSPGDSCVVIIAIFYELLQPFCWMAPEIEGLKSLYTQTSQTHIFLACTDISQPFILESYARHADWVAPIAYASHRFHPTECNMSNYSSMLCLPTINLLSNWIMPNWCYWTALGHTIGYIWFWTTEEEALSRLDSAGHCESGHKNFGTKLAVEVHQVVGDQWVVQSF